MAVFAASTVMCMDYRYMLGMAYRGFHGALHRFDATDEEVAFLPATEAVYWACVLDEQLEADHAAYAASTEYGKRILTGVRYARNRVTHQLPMLFRRTDGKAYPQGNQDLDYEIRWRHASELPEKRGANVLGSAEDGGREAYMDLLSDQPVRKTLHQIADWFAAVQNWPSSPLQPSVRDWGHFAENATVLVVDPGPKADRA